MTIITLMPMHQGSIYIDGNPVEFDGYLFNNDLDACGLNSHIDAYNKMQDFLRLTKNDEQIDLFIID